MQTITTLGYQQTVEFYSPAYDTEAKKESVKPDLRSTIYWNRACRLMNRELFKSAFIQPILLPIMG